jgi:cytochrome c oxidase assembly protein subunit 15
MRKESVWLHRFALLTAGTTFLLIYVGGIVTSTGAGLAVPDWPTTFGHNMFLYPWSKMRRWLEGFCTNTVTD